MKLKKNIFNKNWEWHTLMPSAPANAYLFEILNSSVKKDVCDVNEDINLLNSLASEQFVKPKISKI